MKSTIDLPADPWGLTQRQREALASLAATGSQTLAADRMGACKSLCQKHLYDAKARMGARTTTHALVQWVRFEEQQLANGVKR